MVEAGLSSSEITRQEVNGQDQLANLPRSQRETEYVKSISPQDQMNRTQNQPRLELREWISFSNVTFRIGYQMRL